MAKVLCVPDLHSPYSDLEALSSTYLQIEKEKPDTILQLGDSLDLYSFSKFPRSHNLLTPRQELEQGFELVRDMWKIINRIAPKAIKYQLLGNHEERLPKRVLERLPEAETLFRLKEVMSFPGVQTITTEELEIDGVLYIHGFMTRPYAHMRYFLKSVVLGHTHQAWVLYEKVHRKTLFEMTCGYLADDSQIPLQYTASKINKWSKGCGIIDSGVPRFVPA